MMMFAEELRLLDKRFQQRNQLGALEVKEESRKRKLETPRFEPTHSRHPDLQLNDQPTHNELFGSFARIYSKYRHHNISIFFG